jgi:Family of unknown function (DUF6314)
LVAGQTGVVTVVDPAPDDLLGQWRLRRRLVDRQAAVFGAMAGRLVLSRDGEDLVWSEAGVLRWLGRDVEVSRRYLIRETGDGWWVLFDDGRPFHRWTPGIPVEHACGADMYRGVIEAHGLDRWRVLWDVTGPDKRQRIVTRLTR